MDDVAPASRRVSFSELALAVLRYWWLVLGAAVAGVLIALYYVTHTAPTYQARMILAPQQNLLSGARGGSAGGLGSLLSIASGGGGGDIAKLEIMLKSDRLAEVVWRDKALLRRIFVSNWNPATQSWRPRDSGLGVWLLGLLDIKLPAEPTPDDVQVVLTGGLTIKPEQQLYRNITFSGKNPETARLILKDVVAIADRELRNDDRERLERMISYTTDRLKGITVARQAEAVSSVLLSLEQQRMLATASKYYTFDLIQDAEANTRPVSPRPLIAIATGLVGLPALAIIGIILFYRPRNRFNDRSTAA